MDDARWRRYIQEHHDMDLGATRGSRNCHSEVCTPKGIAPVAPLLGETALEYAAVWFLKLVNDPNQVQNKLRDYTHVLEDLANYAKSRHRGPRLLFYVVRWLLAVRSHRYSKLVSRYGPEIFGPRLEIALVLCPLVVGRPRAQVVALVHVLSRTTAVMPLRLKTPGATKRSLLRDRLSPTSLDVAMILMAIG
ncbi:hypothetical protein Ae201684P_009441 [Aphanomyces euteiches]|nr:hypothetical protein Ae201684P_009441 [Aphanomyces euteiches]